MLEVRSPLTYEEFLRIREDTRDRTELIDGVLFVTPSPSLAHQFVAQRLFRAFDSWFMGEGGGVVVTAPLDIRFTSTTVVQPDVIVVLPDRLHMLKSNPVTGVPSIAIEVLSPSNNRHDLVIKRDLYARYGVPEYWVADSVAQAVTIMSNPLEGRYQSVVTSLDVATSVQVPAVKVAIQGLFSPDYP